MKISGMADRAGSEFTQLGPDVEVPDDVTVRIDFSGDPVGRATLRRDENGDIWADAEIVDERAQRMLTAGVVSHFAVSIKVDGRVDPGVQDRMKVDRDRVIGLSLVDRNIDPDQPPFGIDAY